MPVNSHGRRRTPRPTASPLAWRRLETASRLGISVRTLELLGAEGPPIVRIGRRVLYPVNALEQWLARRTEPAA